MRNKNLYNYVVNTIGLSKEVVMQCVQDRLESIVTKHVQSKLDSKEMERIVLDKVSEIVSGGFKERNTYYRTTFDDFVMGKVRAVLEERLNKEYKLDVKMIEKEKKTIARATRKVRVESK